MTARARRVESGKGAPGEPPGGPRGRWAILAAAAAIVCGVLAAMGPIPQPPGYHRFADSRTVLGIFGFWNVVSNAAFVLAGAWGVAVVLHRRDPGLPAGVRLAYLTTFAGGFLTGLGSAWYHHAPDNATLLWDRMAMAVTFMAFAALIVGERIRPAACRPLLVLLVPTGILSTVSWYRSEQSGSGDMRFYLLVQLLPFLLALLILLLWRSPPGRERHFGAALAAYALAKVAESLDVEVFRFGGVVSGHTLKHLLAAVALALLALGAGGARRRGSR